MEIHLEGTWRPCAQLELSDPAQATRHAPVRVRYDTDYAVENLGAHDFRALTVRAPVDLGTRNLPRWPSFLVDLLPQGAARKRIERIADTALSEWALLERGAVNPVGNLRIRPQQPRVLREHGGFELSEMAARGDEFVDRAHELGATVAGATDTQGEAPKFWVVQDPEGRWHPDSGALAFTPRRHALLKFPVPEAGPRAADILRHEAAYQRVAQRLGIRVTDSLPETVGNALLIPRFDRRSVNDAEVRLGVESLYSICGVLDSGTTHLPHHECLIALGRCVTSFETELTEYVRRDLLNLALGNRDNHGRNAAVLKDTDGGIRLAPIYDFGPAFLDARALVRVMRWDGEEAGRRDWNLILDNLATRFDEAGVAFAGWTQLRHDMRAFADPIRALPELMEACGVDSGIIAQRRQDIDRLAAELDAIGER